MIYLELNIQEFNRRNLLIKVIIRTALMVLLALSLHDAHLCPSVMKNIPIYDKVKPVAQAKRLILIVGIIMTLID